MNMRDRLVARSRPLLPPDARVEHVFACQTGPNPLILPLVAVAFAVFAMLFAGSVRGDWIVVILGPCLLVYLLYALSAAKARVVCVTDEATLVLAASKTGMRPKELLATLPRTTLFGPVTGLWARVRVGTEKAWVHKRFHRDVVAADASATTARRQDPE
jgi:hypothetical protein